MLADSRCRTPYQGSGFDRDVYRHRDVVGRRSNRLKQWRGPATRHGKTRENSPRGHRTPRRPLRRP
ncbi:hypothetical protein [Streptomyces sp. NPDC052092]|uniref:hypothetical protein n=1 Tax=Streptomyces sp. NPDC052092 TaxID=3365685 RepID=UPI0037D78F2C